MHVLHLVYPELMAWPIFYQRENTLGSNELQRRRDTRRLDPLERRKYHLLVSNWTCNQAFVPKDD